MITYEYTFIYLVYGRTWQTVTDLQRENTVALLHNSPLGRGSPPVPSREDDEQSLHGLIATEDSNLRLSKAEKSVSSVKNTGDTILAREHQHLKQARRRPSSARQTWGSPTVRSDIRTTAKSPQIRSEVSGLTQPEWESSLRIEYAPSPPRIVAAVRPAKSERRGGDGGAEDQRQAKVRSPHRPAVKPSHQTQASIKVGASPRTSRRLPQAPETTRGSRQREQLAIAGSRVTAAELFKAVEVETDLTLYKITTDSVAKENKTPPQTETSAAAVRDDFRAWLAWRSEETARAAAEATQAHFANVGSNLEDLTRTTDDSIVCSHFTN